MFIQVVLGISVGATISIAELAHTISVPVIVGLRICLMLQTDAASGGCINVKAGIRSNRYWQQCRARWLRYW